MLWALERKGFIKGGSSQFSYLQDFIFAFNPKNLSVFSCTPSEKKLLIDSEWGAEKTKTVKGYLPEHNDQWKGTEGRASEK